MDKNSLIIEIKNDINSIKKQLEVTLAKLDVLEALIKLEVRSEELGVRNSCASESRSRACSDYAERSQESPLGNVELEVKENTKSEPVAKQSVEPTIEVEPVVEIKQEPIIEVQVSEPEPELVVTPAPEVEEPEPEPELEPIIEEKIEEEVEEDEEEESTPHSSHLTPHCETEFRNLMSVIGLNDRFRFRHDLFSNSDELFRETIDILNKVEDFDKAVDYLMGKFNWDEEDATVVYFYDIIKPKF